MTTPSHVLRKLRASIEKCSPHGVARPMWVQDVHDAIRLIEQQQEQIEALTAKQPITETAENG